MRCKGRHFFWYVQISHKLFLNFFLRIFLSPLPYPLIIRLLHQNIFINFFQLFFYPIFTPAFTHRNIKHFFKNLTPFFLPHKLDLANTFWGAGQKFSNIFQIRVCQTLGGWSVDSRSGGIGLRPQPPGYYIRYAFSCSARHFSTNSNALKSRFNPYFS